MERCASCVFWTPSNNGLVKIDGVLSDLWLGRCVKNPPLIHNGTGLGVWPAVLSNERCGSWKAKPPRPLSVDVLEAVRQRFKDRYAL
jgi:hypothetical protein